MEITNQLICERGKIIGELKALAMHHDNSTPLPSFVEFLENYLTTFCLEEWVGRELNDLYYACKGFYLFLSDNHKRVARVRIFNPTLDEDGWLCGRTVVLITCVDSPFLVDSIRMEMNKRELPIHIVKSTVMNVKRSSVGELAGVSLSRSRPEHTSPLEASPEDQHIASHEPSTDVQKEALIYFEINALAQDSLRSALKATIEHILVDIHRVVTNYSAIVSRLNSVRDNVATHTKNNAEVVEFLDWLPKRHFTFLGLREYDLVNHTKNTITGQTKLIENIDQRLGIFTKLTDKENIVLVDDFSQGIRDFYLSDSVIFFSKSSTRSNVHRSVYPDYLVVKKFDDAGNVCGEVRFLGLFTYNVSNLSPMNIPVIRKKAAFILSESGLDPESHDGRNILRIIESYPKDELFQTDKKTLYQFVSSIAAINERHLVRLILRKDPFGSFVNCLVFVPRDLYTTQVRVKIERIIGDAIGSTESDSITYFSESNLARAQIIFRVDPQQHIDVDIADLEEKITDATQNWIERLSDILIEHFGESAGTRYVHNYKHAFPQSYQSDFDARAVIGDIAMAETLSTDDDIAMSFYQPIGSNSHVMRFKAMRLNSLIELSTAIPILENLGLRVLGEQPYKIKLSDGRTIWMHDFSLKFGLPITLDVHIVKPLFESAFNATWLGCNESDGFNRLILAARLNWREVSLLRAFANYLKQTAFSSSLNFIADTLVAYPEITRNLVALFKSNFDPRLNKESNKEPHKESNKAPNITSKKENNRSERLVYKTIEALDAVVNLNQDTVLRRYLDLIQATLRTNFFQKDDQELDKPYISLKFSPRKISDIPEPRPLYEIFVYSARVEGVHLRGDSVSRGGLRWSDRMEDYRTEVLGLVKAQQVKNAVIVPHGAKGGFVAKQLPQEGGRAAFMAEGIACYKIFIRGLLDVTDNLMNGELIPPKHVVRIDGDDPYLVVAADKGTATFSDIANDISDAYGHWLGDAFASGGSQGYDHKGMGITARGAWVSVQRHFRELGINIQQQDFTVIGVGDMAGDVFGNGMLLSEHICLTAAFNHMHIFIDPTPTSSISFEERKRLFNTPGTNWADYNAELISKGGGVFLRSAKTITITPEMKKAFDLQDDVMAPNDLIHALLKAPVDLIWNGGIGTYVKAVSESHNDVGDKANDCLRVNGQDLRCKVIGEGGNLGFTQRGRIEFALNGGACNTDFIDNAAGVDCSDHEVNIKILLDEIVANGDLTAKQRNQFLADMTQSVADLVLQNNYRQTFAISVAQSEAISRTNEYRRFINHLETLGKLDRELEFLPSDEEIVERIGKGKALTRPELSVLISYAKVQLKEAFFSSDIAEDQYMSDILKTAFPPAIAEKYSEQMVNHRLKKEIVGTQIANDMVNNLGITSVYRLSETMGASLTDIAKAYVISRDVFRLEEFQNYIRSLDNCVPSSFQSELMANMVRRVRRGTRWFLRNRRGALMPAQDASKFAQGLLEVHTSTERFVKGRARDEWLARSESYRKQGVDEFWSQHLSMPDNLFSGLGIIESAFHCETPTQEVAQIFFLLLDRLNLNWFATQLSEVKVETYWQALARESYIDDLEVQLRKLTIAFTRLRNGRSVEETYDAWMAKSKYLVNRWKIMVNEVQSSQVTDYAMFSVALRELIDLTQATDFLSDVH